MKISFVEPHLKVYGGIRRIIELSNRLTRKGHDVTIFHSDGSPCEWMKCDARFKSYDEVLKEEHDVIIYNDPNPIDYSLVKKAKAKLKVFYVLGLYKDSLLKGVNPRVYFPRNSRMLFIKKSLQSSYLKLTCSTWLYYWLRKNMHIDSQMLIGGINTEHFHPVEVEKNPNEIRILCSGGPRKYEGTQTVIDAVEIIKKKGLSRVVLDSYYGKRIPQEKMAEKYSSADLFVDGRWHGGWNNPVAEAMACKVPVVCTDIGGVKDFAFHDKTALLVPVKDPEAMASAILRLIRDEELREKLRENAYLRIKCFGWDECAERLEEILVSQLHKIDFNRSYIGDRRDIVDLIPESVRKVLDVGCSIGTLSEGLRQKLGDVEIVGIEMDKQMGEVAKTKLDKVIVEDVENVDLSSYFRYCYFDCMVFGDILEHLKNPWDVLKNAVRFLSNDGVVVASIPNVAYYSTIFHLVINGCWPYRKRGIYDKNHLRFFTLKNIKQMFEQADMEIVEVRRKYRIIERGHKFDGLARIFAFPPFAQYFTFQYLVCARKGDNNGLRRH